MIFTSVPSTERVCSVPDFHLKAVLFSAVCKNILVVVLLCTMPKNYQAVAVERYLLIPGNKGVNNFVFLSPNLLLSFCSASILNLIKEKASLLGYEAVFVKLAIEESGRKINSAQNLHRLG